MLVIKDAKIFTSANKVIEKGDILVEDGKIIDVKDNIAKIPRIIGGNNE